MNRRKPDQTMLSEAEAIYRALTAQGFNIVRPAAPDIVPSCDDWPQRWREDMATAIGQAR